MEGYKIGLFYAKLDRTLDLTGIFNSGKTEIIVGRSHSSCDLAIPYKPGVNEEVGEVSKKHCRLSLHRMDRDVSDPDRTEPYSPISVRDLGSRNGTVVDGRKLDENEEAYLFNGNKLKLGSVVLEVKIEDPRVTQPLSGETKVV